MTLDAQDLRTGLKFIVGTWQVDFIVNAFSNDLAHIPAAEFKSQDGTDFSAITFTFFEDHTLKMENTATGKQTDGTWEQTGMSEFRYTQLEEADRQMEDKLSKLDNLGVPRALAMQGGNLVFSLGFLAVSMKKTAEGTITKEPDIGDIQPGEADLAMTDIVGTYEVAKAFSMVGGKLGLHAKDDVLADLEARKAAGEIDDDEIRSSTSMFDMRVEFTADHKLLTWMKIPDGITDEQIKEAIEAGEIGEVKDGFFAGKEQEWKAVDGKYYYNTNEHRELFGEEQSPWDELKTDEEGLIDFSSGMAKLRKI